MTHKSIVRNLKVSIGSNWLLYSVTSLFLLIVVITGYGLHFCIFPLVISGMAPTQTEYFDRTFGGPWIYSLLFMFWVAITLFLEGPYFRSTLKVNKKRNLEFDDFSLLKNTWLMCFRQDMFAPLALFLGAFIVPAGALKALARLTGDIIPLPSKRIHEMAALIIELRKWPDGISDALFAVVFPERNQRRALMVLEKFFIVTHHRAGSPDAEIFLNRQVLSRWAAGSLFIPPVDPVCQVFASNFITLNNYSRALYWKIVSELFITIIIKMTVGILLAFIPAVILALVLYSYPLNWALAVFILLLGGILSVLSADITHFSKI